MHHWAVTQSLSSDSHRVQGRNWMLSPHSNLSHLHKTMLSSAKNRNRSAGAQFHVFARAAIHPLGFTRLFCVWSSSAQQGTVSCPRTKCTWYSASCKSFKHIYEAGSYCSVVSVTSDYANFKIWLALVFGWVDLPVRIYNLQPDLQNSPSDLPNDPSLFLLS